MLNLDNEKHAAADARLQGRGDHLADHGLRIGSAAIVAGLVPLGRR